MAVPPRRRRCAATVRRPCPRLERHPRGAARRVRRAVRRGGVGRAGLRLPALRGERGRAPPAPRHPPAARGLGGRGRLRAIARRGRRRPRGAVGNVVQRRARDRDGGPRRSSRRRRRSDALRRRPAEPSAPRHPSLPAPDRGGRKGRDRPAQGPTAADAQVRGAAGIAGDHDLARRGARLSAPDPARRAVDRRDGWADRAPGRDAPPIRRARAIRCPILFCVVDDDVITPTDLALEAADAAPRSEVRRYAGGHFDPYVGELFERVVADQVDFLSRHLLGEPAAAGDGEVSYSRPR